MADDIVMIEPTVRSLFWCSARHRCLVCSAHRRTALPGTDSSKIAAEKREMVGKLVREEHDQVHQPHSARVDIHVQGRSSGFGLSLLGLPGPSLNQWLEPLNHVRRTCRGFTEQTSMPITAARPRWLFTTLPYSPGWKLLPGHLEQTKRITNPVTNQIDPFTRQ